MSNKHRAWRYWELLGEGRIDEALDMVSDSGTWWLLRHRSLHPVPEMKKYIRQVVETVPAQFFLHSAIEDGDNVMLEVESIGRQPDGAVWNNRFCFLVTMWGDKILHVKEYSDTQMQRDRGNQPAEFPRRQRVDASRGVS